MAYCNDIDGRRPLSRAPSDVGYGETIGNIVRGAVHRSSEHLSAWRKHRRVMRARKTTEAEIARLAPQIRRDIGWPGNFYDE